MNRAAIFSLFIGVSLFAAAAVRVEGNAPASVAPQQNALAPVEFLIGSWQATGQMPNLGEFTVHRTYQKILGGSFIEMRETFHGEKRNIEARAILGVEPSSGKITVWGFAGDDSIVEMTLTDASTPLSFSGGVSGGLDPGPLRVIIQKAAEGFEETWTRNMPSTNPVSMRFIPASAGAGAAVAEAAKPAADSPLAPLGKFIGTWLIEGESEGQRFTVEYTFGWALGGRFMTTSYSVGMGGPPQLHALSITGYDPATNELVQRGFNEEGSVLRARMTVTGDTLVWEGQMTGPHAQTLRSTYRLKDADTLEFTTEVKQGDAWQSMGTAPMRRKK